MPLKLGLPSAVRAGRGAGGAGGVVPAGVCARTSEMAVATPAPTIPERTATALVLVMACSPASLEDCSRRARQRIDTAFVAEIRRRVLRGRVRSLPFGECALLGPRAEQHRRQAEVALVAAR